MLNAIIAFALRNRLLILCVALAVIVGGGIVAASLPIDVLPDLTRPRVVLITECHGMAPEEVEQLVSFPLETSINGAAGVNAVRSMSDIGISIVYVDFDWGTDIYVARQIVQERISAVENRLPESCETHMGPISSLLGQIMIIGMWSEDDMSSDGGMSGEQGATGPLELRTLADWTVRQRLLTIPGVSQVIAMGGGRKQYQVLVDPHLLHKFEVSLTEVEDALRESNLNVTGGYLDSRAKELLVRGLGRIHTLDELRSVVVKDAEPRPILLDQVATVQEGAQVKRGDSSVNGRPAVVLTVQKQPGVDTRRITADVVAAIDELRDSLPADVVIDPTLYQQREFIDYSVANVAEALRDGAILVVIVLFLFLLNFRTTCITLTAIPLSVLVTAIVFRAFDLSINVMTLGGIAVALGELVDDAIVDVENIFRRLKENARRSDPRPVWRVVFEASVEVRNAIIISTMLVIIVFAPLFALSGMEGRLFTPLAIAYIVAILASTLVSLTVTPVLSYYLLPKAKATVRGSDGPVIRGLKALATPVIRFSMHPVGMPLILGAVAVTVLASVVMVSLMGKDFLPPFDEGAAQVNLYTEPGSSLETSREVRQIADRNFGGLLATEENPEGPLLSFTCRTGRAELDEHVMGVHVSEYIMSLNPESGLSRQELIEALHAAVDDIPGVQHEVEQPLAHMISHMLSGVQAQIAIKLYGDDLDVLRRRAEQIKAAIADMDGIAEPFVEQQQLIPQLRIELRRDRLAFYGISAAFVHEFVETAMNGRVVSQIIEGQRTFDLLLRMAEPHREDIANLRRMPLDLPDGTRVPLSAVAHVYEGAGPNTIQREDARRRIVVRVNTLDRDLGSTVAEIRRRVNENVSLPEGYFVTYGGQFEAQKAATRRILLLSAVAAVAVFVLLYSTYPSANIVLQILIALPVAFVGGVAAVVLTGQTLSVASMVGFISLGGIAARNGLLLVSTYLDLIPAEGLRRETILSGSLERLAPVLMTGLTTGMGLIPLVLGGHLPGKEILFPVATVILGGLITSTLAEFLVRPGLFWFFSQEEGPRLAKQLREDGESEEQKEVGSAV